MGLLNCYTVPPHARRLRPRARHRQATPVSPFGRQRYVPGAYAADVVTAVADYRCQRAGGDIDYLGAGPTDVEQAEATTQAYRRPVAPARCEGLTSEGRAEVSVKLSAIGQSLPADGPRSPWRTRGRSALPRAPAGTTVTLDMGTTPTDATLEACTPYAPTSPSSVWRSGPTRPHRGDCRDLATDGGQVRLLQASPSPRRSLIGTPMTWPSYVRWCLKSCSPALATDDRHPDPRLVEIAAALTRHHGR